MNEEKGLGQTRSPRIGAPEFSRAVLRVVVATGISSVVLQLLSIREFLTRFHGNEFVIALIIFSWFSLGGIGTFFAQWITRRYWRPTAGRLGWISMTLIALSILQIPVIRECYDLVFIPGSSVGFYPTLLYILITLAPYCCLLGFALPFSLFVLRSQTPDYPGAWIYLTDNLGDISGGVLFSFALIFLATPFVAICLANMPLLITIFPLYYKSEHMLYGPLLAGALLLGMMGYSSSVEKQTLFRPEGHLIHYKESRYGRIEIHQNRELKTLFVDGVPLFTNQNQNMAEEIIHYPMSQVNQPKHILIVSGEGGIMKEIDKYHPETVDYVELDPEMTLALLQFEMMKAIKGLHIIHQDARAFLSKTHKRYDAVIINLPEPETFQLNRFYTDEFYGIAKRRLSPEGVLGFSMQGFDNYLPEPQRRKLSIVYNTVKRHFKHVRLLPGQQIFFLCSDLPITTDIPSRLFGKGITTRYISSYFIGNVTQKRILDLNQLVNVETPVNHDYAPRLMLFMFSQWFTKYATSPDFFIVTIVSLSALYLIFISKESYVLFTTGFLNMGCELLVIFAFQIIFGYIYYQIGVIVTVFLAGLLPGAWLGNRNASKNRTWLMLADGLLILLPGLFVLGIIAGGGNLPVSFFLGFGFMVSLATGFQFPVALHLRGSDNSSVSQAFSADLIGAAFGILITSLFFIPYLGIIGAAYALMGIKLSSLLVNFIMGFQQNATKSV